MNLRALYSIKNDYTSTKFLRENSYWYKYLNRSDSYLKDFKEDMKDKYKLKFEDKLDKFSKNLDRVSDIIDIFS